ncbi:MAG: DNA-processing protein DprA [Hyphomicrobiales bacterium]|nr:DNA-processing protein DprA [Hyphomicrobiales bacterium]
MQTPSAGGRIGDGARIDWLRLMRCENVGPATFRALVAEFGSPDKALDALPDLAARGGRRRYRVCARETAEAELQAAREHGARLLVLADEGYPALLAQIEPPPPGVYVKGREDLVGAQSVAIVGSRNASANGQSFARQAAADLGAAGLVVVSGLARGVDTAAHWGSLDSGAVAVVAGGVDVIYPLENSELYQRIASEGAIVSECAPGFQPRGQDFPRRNRLISGLSLGVVIVEAARQSGSLITARFALEQNREVFAVPGHPLDPRAAGPNDLIRAGAVLMRSAADVLAELRPALNLLPGFDGGAPAVETALPPPSSGVDISPRDRELVLSALSATPVALDALTRSTGLSPRIVNIALLELTLAGRVVRDGGARVALKIT